MNENKKPIEKMKINLNNQEQNRSDFLDSGDDEPLKTNSLNSIKRSNSQVFENDDLDNDNDNGNEYPMPKNSSRRKSSWAFWKSENDDDINAINSSELIQDKKNTNLTSNILQDSIVDKQLNDKDVINNDENLINSKERIYSWSFWSSSTKDNLKNNQILSIPDVIKSDVSNSNTTDNRKKINNNIKRNNESKRLNIILPKIEDNLPLLSTHNIIVSGFKRLKKIIGYSNERDSNLFRKDEPTIFKRVLIIGVHGFFPTKMIRPIIGEPTGTSMKFAQVGESAVLSWAKDNNLNIEIQKIALEKEGKIFDRVDFFFDILKNSINDIKKADFIFFCSHSQGTPVSVILLSKLIEYGIIDDNKKIGLLGMAGINIGPFSGMDKSLFIRAYSTIENESLLELFQFQNFESLQSRKYIECLRNLVRHDVKITFVGSIDDQLVPLYSAIALHVQHPNIYKAVYIDGATNTPNFLSRIIKLSCMLQNIGSTDHDVIKEISTALAGPITGGGHSKIYNDLQVYKLALDFTLKTESSNIALEQSIKYKPFDIKKHGVGYNPFNLPWCARGLFFESIKRLPHGKEEIDLVFREFDEWEPDSKALKDVKYRLNGIKAKL